MKADLSLLRACGFSESDIKLLRQQHVGGISGGAGYDFQRWYALVRLVEFCQLDLGVDVAVEMPLCPVDDVVLEGITLNEHVQCKISPRETWGKSRGKLRKEFLSQWKLFRAGKITNGTLVLVVAEQDHAKRLSKRMPANLKRFTRVEHFSRPVPVHHTWRIPRMESALNALLPMVLQGPSMRELLYKEFNHVAGTPWQPQTVQSCLASVMKNESLPIIFPTSVPFSWSVPPKKWVQAQQILTNIPHLTVDTNGGVCTYELLPTDSGFVARCDTGRFEKFVEDVIAFQPRTMIDFLKVLPR